MKDWYQKDEQEILKELNVTKEGLTAGQAEQLLLEKGENVLKEGKRRACLRYSRSSSVTFSLSF